MFVAGWVLVVPIVLLLAVGIGLLIGGAATRERNRNSSNGLLVAGGVVTGLGLVPLALGTLFYVA